ncbi:MAG: glycoside hydrolase family 105 protein [Gemmatimonadaceae bacterium]
MLFAAGATAGAQQLPHLAAAQGLGEGSRQPGDSAYAIPNAAARPKRSATPWAVRMARSVMTRNPQTHRRWDYTAGVVLTAMERVALARNDRAMLDYVKANTDRFLGPDGSIVGYDSSDWNLDQVSQGRVLLALHARTRDARYRRAADVLRAQLRGQPRTREGGFWHKQVYPQQMWLDGLYMAEPFYAQYARDFGEPSAFDDITRQFLLMARHSTDPATGLMVHGWDAARAQKWADTLTGRSPAFWGRSLGWYLLGAVDALDYIPATHPDRDAVIQTVRVACEGLARVQDPLTGLWYNVLDQGDRPGNYLEGSASSIFAYVFAKGARLGYLDARYRRLAERAFDGLLSNLVRENADGTVSLTNIMQSAGLGGSNRKDGSYRSGTFFYYNTEPVVTDDYKGVGPFIMAAQELGR